MAEQKPPKIVVIGAGLAGLTTAYRLHESGFDVEVFEARNRVGGRVLTVMLDENLAELGGQNLLDGGKAENILSLIGHLGLKTETSRLPLHLKYFDGTRLIDPNILLKKYQFTPNVLKEQFRSIRSTASNMKDVLQALFYDNEVLYQTFWLMLAGYEGAPPENLSLVYLETLYHMLLGGISSAHQGNGEENASIDFRWVKGGNSLIAIMLAKRLGHRVHLLSPLRSLAKTKTNSYLLTFESGNQISADLIVLAVPCTVFNDIEIDEEAIPIHKQKAIQSVKYGTNSKIVVPVIPPRSKIGSFTNGRAAAFFPGSYHAITLYYIGEYGDFNEDTIEETFQHDLPLLECACVLPLCLESPVMAADQSYLSYSGPVGYSWPNDPYAKGSYSCIASGQETLLTSLEDFDTETVKSLFAPIEDRLFFAGEHTSILLDVSGTMEAAVESGERTARLIQKRWGCK